MTLGEASTGIEAGFIRTALRAIGSLWYGAVILLLLLVAMACATVYESRTGTEQALADFYRAWWFAGLLGLLGVNVLAALVVRYPFTRKQIGFVLTHVSIVVTLVGALVTQEYGVEGQVGVVEGQTVREFTDQDTDQLTVMTRADGSERSVDLTSSVYGGFKAVDHPPAPQLSGDNLQIKVARFVPHSSVVERVVNTNPRSNPAVEVSLSTTGLDDPRWLFAAHPDRLGALPAVYRFVDSSDELAALLADKPADESKSDGVIKLEQDGSTFEVTLQSALEGAVPVGESGLSVHATRYLPHASVGQDKKLVSLSDRPVNPAVELEITSPAGTEKRLAFSRFPDFGSMHGENKTPDLKVTFVAPGGGEPTAPIELLGGPGGALYVRFWSDAGERIQHELTAGQPVNTPWPGRKLAVIRRFNNARFESEVTPKEPSGTARVPALLVTLTSARDNSEMWVQKYRPTPVVADGVAYDLIYGNKVRPLGFDLTLNRFHIGHYPGTMRPRSFESHVTVVDPRTGRERSHVISMNHPVKAGGYNLYQSSYRQDGGRSISYISVARDPGQAVVFAGYIGTIAGMLIVLVTRTVDRRRSERSAQALGHRSGEIVPERIRRGLGETTIVHGNGRAARCAVPRTVTEKA